MSMFKGFSNAFSIPELRKKILITLGLVLVCRLISMVPTVGVNWQALKAAVDASQANAAAAGVMGWLDLFTGGAFGQCAIGFLSIWPYISAQIVIQLLSSVIPSLNKLRQEGESGRQQLAQITRYLTIVICVAQAWGVATLLLNPEALAQVGIKVSQSIVTMEPISFKVMTVICMTTASLFVMWIADQITTFGIGNGASLIIMINITSRLPTALLAAYQRYFGPSPKNPLELVLLLLFGFAVVMGTVMLVQGVRKVKICSTRRSAGGGNTYGMQESFMPLRVNYTGVMPIIFAQPIMQVASFLFKCFPENKSTFLLKLHQFGVNLGDSTSATHLVIYAAFIMFFAFFWVATQFNAIQISENLKKGNSYIPGVRPGMATAEYLDAMMTRVTLIGGTGLLLVALIPELLMGWRGINWVICSFFGGTSLLIAVGVSLDTLRIMESHLLVRKYDGFLRHGTLRGRGGM